jgi:hypothetical protein
MNVNLQRGRITKGRTTKASPEYLLGLQRSIRTAWTRESRNMENLKRKEDITPLMS